MKLKTRLVYAFNDSLRIFCKLNIMSTEDSIDYLKNNQCSLSRFGDGEMNILMGADIHFQKYDALLAKRLLEVLQYTSDEKLMIGIPLAINTTEGYKKIAADFWRMNMQTGRMHWLKLCGKKTRYLNASMTRCYIDYADKEQSALWFKSFLELMDDKRLLIVEGRTSRLGVSNDMFSKSRSVKRILCPPENAWSVYDEILGKVADAAKDFDLILVSLGPTASVLCYDLAMQGLRALDIGHLNLEYNKYIEQMCAGGNCGGDIISEEEYQDQLMAKL